jgi:hypothetical protein
MKYELDLITWLLVMLLIGLAGAAVYGVPR